MGGRPRSVVAGLVPAKVRIRGNGELKIPPLKLRGVRGVMREWRGSSPFRSGGACPRLKGDYLKVKTI